MSKSRLVSGRIKKVTGAELSVDRYEFLDLANAEPDLGNPNADGSILVADIDGTRYWTPNTPSVVAIDDLSDVDTSTVPPTDGQALVYDNTSGIWKPGDSAGVTSSITPPVSPNENDLWFNTENLNLYIYYNDGDSVQWVQVNTAGASGTGGGEGGGGGGGGSGVVVYDTVNELPLNNNTAGDQAYVTSTNRLYLWTGNGWFNIALINTNPTITQGPNAAYSLNRDGSPTVITLIAQDPEGIPITWSYQVTTGALGNTATIVQADNVFTITPSTDQADVGTFGVTFVASDGVNIATAISSFRLFFVAADQYYNQSILLTTSTVDGGDNNTFIDSSTNNFTITRNGNTTQGSFSPYGDRWSNYFDGVGDYLTAPANTDFAFGQGDLTVEMWLYPTTGITTPANIGLFYIEQTGGLVVGLTDGKIALGRRALGYSLITTYIPPVNAWTHISVTRSGATAYIFANGVLVGSVTGAGGDPANNADYVCTTGLPVVAGNYSGGAGFGSFPGYISDLRVVKGTAIYTSNFAPPTEPLTAVAGTSLLTCQSNRFKDNSVNNFTLTKSGDVKVTKFSPYLPTEPYDPITFSGSAYFDGAGDYLTIPNNTALALGTGDFTVEVWLYISAYNASTTRIIDWRSNGGAATNIPVLTLSATGVPAWFFTVGSGAAITGSSALALNTWTHLAIARSGSTATMYLNGTSIGSATSSLTLGIESLNINDPSAGSTYGQRGYFSNIRIVKGTAVYTSNFTPPTQPIAAVANTSLLCNFTNANIYDETGKIVLETVGNAQVDTAVTKFGTGGSMYFDGTDSLTFTGATSGAGDFTTEAWVNLSALLDYNVVLDNRSTGTSTTGYAFGVTATGAPYLYTSNAFRIVSSITITANTWNHLALVRSGTTITIYVNGVSGGTYTSSANFSDTNNLIGVTPTFGYIEDLRITKGVARYTANFTPPTQKLGFNNDE